MNDLPTHPMLHPITDTPVTPIGFRADGRAIWSAMGGDETTPPGQPAAQPPVQPPVAVPAPPPQQQFQTQPPAVYPAPQQPGAYQYPPQPFQQPPAPAQYAPPQQQAPVPAPQTPAPAQPPAAGQNTPPAQGDQGFPANTPWREMKPEEQVAYWQHQSRKHEQRVSQMSDYEQLRTQAADYQRHLEANQTEHQRAITEAHRQGATEALAQANGQLVDQWVRAAAVGRLAPESVDALLANLNRQAFVTSGAVDTDKVWGFVSSLTGAPGQSVPQPPASAQAPHLVQQQSYQLPAQQQPQVLQPVGPPRTPDFGQGQPPAPKASGLEAGRLLAQQRFAKNNPQKPVLQ